MHDPVAGCGNLGCLRSRRKPVEQARKPLVVVRGTVDPLVGNRLARTIVRLQMQSVTDALDLAVTAGVIPAVGSCRIKRKFDAR